MADKPTYEELARRVRRLEQENAALKQSDAHLKLLGAITENMSESVIATNADFEITYLNKKAEALFGYRLQDVKGQSPGIFNAEPNANEIQARICESVFAGNAYVGEHINKKRDGSTFLCEFKVFPLVAEKGEAYAYVGIQRDVTEQRHGETALKESESKWRNILVNIPQVGLGLDPQGRIIFANSTFLKLTGWSEKQVLGQDWFALCIPLEAREEVRAVFRSVMGGSGKLDLTTYENEILTCNGERRSVAWSNVLTRDAHGGIVDVICLGVDLTERRRAAEALRMSEEKLKESNDILSGILQHTHMMAVYLDSAFNFIWVNQAYADTCCQERSFFPGKNHFDLYPHTENQAIFQQVVDTGEPFFVEAKAFEFPDQPERGVTYWDWSLIPVKNQSGAVEGLVFTLGEVTARVQIEARLHESEYRYRTIFEGSLNPIAIIDTEGRYLEANRAFCDFVDTDPQTLARMQVFDFSPPDRSHLQKADHRPAWCGGGVLETEYLVGGKIKTLMLSVSPIRYQGRDAVVGTGVDITRRKAAEAALRETSELFQKVFEGQPDAIFVLSADVPAVVVACNRATHGIFGYTREEMVGAPITKLHVGDRHLTQFQARLQTAIESGDSLDGFEFSMRRRDGTVFPTEHSVFELKDEQGRRTGWVSIVRDRSERKLLEEHLSQAQKMESIGNLAGGIAHDFNNILFPIVGMSEMLMEDSAPGSPEYESAKEIFKAARRGGDLVKQILAFSRQSDSPKLPFMPQQVVAEVVKLSRSTIPTFIDISQNIQKDCGLVLGDPVQMHQIAMNLITNAYHAIGEANGTISVSLQEIDLTVDELSGSALLPGKYAVLTVKDSGTGIDPAIFDKIFEPYFTTKEKGKGTGLGLAVVYGIVKKHGGHIRYDSEMGKGTRATIIFPLLKDNAVEGPLVPANEQPGGTERILLVDDEASIARMESRMLERLGYTVSAYYSSLDALSAFRTNPANFDLVITDMSMPNMAGDQLARALFVIRPDIPVIICTGFSERMDREKADAMGVKGLLMKPVVKSEIAEMVRRVLDGPADGDET